MPASTRAESAYRMSVAHLLRMAGPVAILLGVGWVVLGAAGLPSTGATALASVTFAAVAAAAALLWRPPRVVTLTESGYRVGRLVGRRQPVTSWRDVESVQAADVDGTRALVFTHADGTRRAIALSLLGNRAAEAQREINFRLNHAYGYRRL